MAEFNFDMRDQILPVHSPSYIVRQNDRQGEVNDLLLNGLLLDALRSILSEVWDGHLSARKF